MPNIDRLPPEADAAVEPRLVSKLREEIAALQRQLDWYKAQNALMSEHQAGTCWYWQGDGLDHPESLVNSLPVVVRADQWRKLIASAPQPTAPSKEALTELVAGLLSGTYHCGRVWSAWGFGTMSEDDFSPVEESDTPAEIADAVLAALSAGPKTKQGDAETVRTAIMGFGRVAVGQALDTESGRPGIVYLDLGEQRAIGSDTTDLFPVGGRPAADKILALIQFETADSVHQTIGVLKTLLAERFSDTSMSTAETRWRELCRRLYVELWHCDQQLCSFRDEHDEQIFTQGATVRDVLADARAVLELKTAPPQPAAPQPKPQLPAQIAEAICRDVSELPDRNSPEYWPEAMLVTADELRQIVLAALAAPQPVAVPLSDARTTELLRESFPDKASINESRGFIRGVKAAEREHGITEGGAQ